MIITALPGSWQKMIQRNLEMQHSVNVVGIAQGSLSALQMAREHHPDLLLIDSAIPSNDAIALIQTMKQEKPKTRSIVITDTTQQRRRFIRAGADYTLLSFNFDSQISEILNQLQGTLIDETEGSESSLE
ncbi:MAG: response regulator [Anaerolineales bacterium]|jgi:DNA-binding NarL/FixJ family response regulator